MTIRQKFIGGLLLTGIGTMVLASNPKRQVKPKNRKGSAEPRDDVSSNPRHGAGMGTADPVEPTDRAHQGGLEGRDLPAPSEVLEAPVDPGAEQVPERDRFTPPGKGTPDPYESTDRAHQGWLEVRDLPAPSEVLDLPVDPGAEQVPEWDRFTPPWMSTADLYEPTDRAHYGGLEVRDLPAPSKVLEAPVDPGAEQGPERDRFTPPTVAPTVLSRAQKVWILLGLVALTYGFTEAPVVTIVALNAFLMTFYVASNSMKVFLISRALNDPCKVTVDAAHGRIPDDELPVYTILLPVYREADMLGQLVDGIRGLDYPEDRLDVKLLLEEDDLETRNAAADLDLPDFFDVSVVPALGPTGKPRACNHGLARARGEYLVIYDAEDRPEADQLRKSVLAFRDTTPEVVCLQAQLNYFNRTRNLLTRWFTAEYSVWFDQLLPGLQAMDVVIPLGGTSNHFITARLREIGGWNAFNVTEDADLGLRIFLRGWKTAILGTTTYEEATSRYPNWIRQRSRWVKGYMQTYLYHMRHPFRLAGQMSPKAFVAFQLFFGAGTLCLLLNPVFWALTIVWFAAQVHLIQVAFPGPVLYLATIGLFIGNAACVLSMVSGCFGRRNYEDVKYAFLVPVYWVLMSVAAWKALVQLFYKPTYWEKTEHGFCLFEGDEEEETTTPSQLASVEVLSAS